MIFSGKVQNIVYENGDFKIIKCLLDGRSTVLTVRGNFPVQKVEIGSWVCFEGDEVSHPQYGKQLRVTRSPAHLKEWDEEKVLSALSAQGVGPSVRHSLKEVAKKKGVTLFILLEEGMLEESELDEFTQLYVLSRWRSVRTYMDGANFMAEIGLSARVIGEVWRTFGSDVEEVITRDPWELVKVPGITFKDADMVASKMGVPLHSGGRVKGAVLSSVSDLLQDGHVYGSTGQILTKVNNSIPGGASPQDVAMAIGELAKANQLGVDRETQEGLVAVYDPWHLEAEEFCAGELARRHSLALNEDQLRQALCKVGDMVRDIEGGSLADLAKAAVNVWTSSRKLSLTDTQLQAAVTALTSRITVLTGLPGTGKTTTLQAIVAVLKDSEIPFLLAAPTGIAAKRMSQVTKSEAVTIHRAFGAKGFKREGDERESTYLGIVGESRKTTQDVESDWEFGPGRPHPAKFVVVDESSMMDLHMLNRLLEATSSDCRILFVGDPYQLPSVGAGDVLRDLVKSGCFPHCHLSEIFRQEGTSGIVVAAHAIHMGEAPESDGRDFIVIDAGIRPDEMECSHTVVDIAKKLYSKRLNFQVLSPRHAGEVGVTALNQKLRLALNPSVAGIGELRLGDAIVREGDRIMVVRNDYNTGVYNGDVGKVSRIDKKAKQVEMKIFQGVGIPTKIVRYPFKDASRTIRLAYAQTVHKSQGQEYDVIVLPLVPSFGRQLQRNLLYTAVTRAKKKVFIVGSPASLAKGVYNNKAQERNSLLATRLGVLNGG